MYRIFCESYENLKKDFKQEAGGKAPAADPRFMPCRCFALLADPDAYHKAKKNGDADYKTVTNLLNYLAADNSDGQRTSALLWTLESRGITGDGSEPVISDDLREQVRMINSFMRLAYWR